MMYVDRVGHRALIAMISCGLVGVALGGCDYLPGYYTYKAEVGYYEGGQQKWYIGSAKSYNDCIAEATSYFDSLKSPSNPKRAFTWSCRKMRGEEILDRVK
jgi:hypothetical protein